MPLLSGAGDEARASRESRQGCTHWAGLHARSPSPHEAERNGERGPGEGQLPHKIRLRIFHRKAPRSFVERAPTPHPALLPARGEKEWRQVRTLSTVILGLVPRIQGSAGTTTRCPVFAAAAVTRLGHHDSQPAGSSGQARG